MINTKWSRKGLNSQKLGCFGEYYAKMALASYGFDIYSSEVDDHGIDFVAETGLHHFLRFQVKTIRTATTGYVFMHQYSYMNVGKGLLAEKSLAFSPDDESLFVVLLLLEDGKEPNMYIIPSSAWKKDSGTTFVYRENYEKPEYGINISQKNITQYLQEYSIYNMIDLLLNK